MTVLIVGGDRVEAIRQAVAKIAPEETTLRVEHWPGRKAADARRSLSAGTRLVVFVCRHLSHPLMLKVRKQADELGVPVVYCRRTAPGWQAELAELREHVFA
ncbi:hypothetical protein [Rhodocyclus purpureus]|uniref:hypothetical protein n=1 Tax=Rhodocyclus purpureus TaxID=1067 RepID=UPI0019143FE3|nr:hypothetical protein [Rhodocyclus purpureus]